MSLALFVAALALARDAGANPPPWDAEALLVVQPEQELDVKCNPGVDCLTPVKSLVGGAVRLGYRELDVWRFGATLGMAHAVDQEENPKPGYSLFSLRLDFDVELGRTVDQFGAALRISPSITYAWHSKGSAVGVDIPGFALLLGLRDLWGEVGVPTLPTPADPRLFYLAVGWRHPWVSGVAGAGTFSTVGYQRDELDRGGAWLGVFAHLETPLTERFYLTLRLVLATPISVALGARFDFE
jgi:hypothetical protein